MAEESINDAVKEALAELLPSTLKEHGIEPPPKKEPESYGEFIDRLKEDLPALLSSQKEDPPPPEGDEGKGKRKPDETPASVHPMFKRIAGGGGNG